jgi:hypothetical protein
VRKTQKSKFCGQISLSSSGIIHFLFPITLSGPHQCRQKKSILQRFISLFELAEHVLLVWGIDHLRRGSTGMNSDAVKLAVYKYFTVLRPVMLKALSTTDMVVVLEG